MKNRSKIKLYQTMTKILSDFHHSGLYYSLHLTLEKRLGYELYRPVGMEWFPDWWRIAAPYNDAIDTAKQYLSLDQRYRPIDGTPPLNTLRETKPTHYEIAEQSHGYIQKAITLEQFKDMDIDVIIASIPDHAITYKKLRDQYKPKAKLIFQVGNMFNELESLIRDGHVKNLMASIKPFDTKVHSVFYHQEVDQDVFKVADPARAENKISSFVIGLPNEQLFLDLKKEVSEYEMTAYASKYAPFVQTTREMADIMARSKFGLHIKPRGDGFGHVIYSWAFMGRPIITNFADYRDKLAGELLIDGSTAINTENRTPKEIAEIIRNIDKDRYKKMCASMYIATQYKVGYEKEAQQIRQFFDGLI